MFISNISASRQATIPSMEKNAIRKISSAGTQALTAPASSKIGRMARMAIGTIMIAATTMGCVAQQKYFWSEATAQERLEQMSMEEKERELEQDKEQDKKYELTRLNEDTDYICSNLLQNNDKRALIMQAKNDCASKDFEDASGCYIDIIETCRDLNGLSE